MKGRVIAAAPGAAALMVDGRLDDLIIDDPNGGPNPGDIFVVKLGRKTGKNAAFCDMGADQSGYLRDARDLRPGDVLLAQMISLPEPGKAPTLAPRVLFKGAYLIATPGHPGVNLSRRIKDEQTRANLLDFLGDFGDEADGLIVREAATRATPDELTAEFATLTKRYKTAQTALAEQTLGRCDHAPALDLAQREWGSLADPMGFDDAGVFDALEALRPPMVRVGSASVVIEATSALIAVDVNTQGDFSAAAGLKANLSAARALPRQLRLRGLGGQIVVDFAPMAQKNRTELETAIKRAFASDPVETSIVGWTKMGLFELQRKRERRPTAAWIAAN